MRLSSRDLIPNLSNLQTARDLYDQLTNGAYVYMNEPVGPGGDPWAGGINNQIDTVFQHCLSFLLYGDLNSLRTAVNIVRWLHGKLPKVDSAHSQRHYSAPIAGLLALEWGAIDAEEFWEVFMNLFNSSYVQLCQRPEIQNPDRLVGITLRPVMRVFGHSIKAAAIMSKFIVAKDITFEQIKMAGGLHPDELANRGLRALKTFLNERWDGRDRDGTRGFNTASAPMMNFHRWKVNGKWSWYWMGFDNPASIGDHEQPFMHFAIVPWALAQILGYLYQLKTPQEVRRLIDIDEVKRIWKEWARWSLITCADLQTGKMMSALPRDKGGFSPVTVELPFYKWSPAQIWLEGETHHSPMIAVHLAGDRIRPDLRDLFVKTLMKEAKFIRVPGRIDEGTLWYAMGIQ